MPENPRASDTPTLADLLSDPIVQLVLKADHLTDEQLRTLIGPALHGPRAETGLPLESNQKTRPLSKELPARPRHHASSICFSLPEMVRHALHGV